MWRGCISAIPRYEKITLTKERELIALAKNGSRACRNEIVMRHLDFITFRINIKVFPHNLKRYGEDLFSELIPILYKKIDDYDLNYRDRNGRRKPVRFSTYIWKRIDGFILDYFRKEPAVISLNSITKLI